MDLFCGQEHAASWPPRAARRTWCEQNRRRKGVHRGMSISALLPWPPSLARPGEMSPKPREERDPGSRRARSLRCCSAAASSTPHRVPGPCRNHGVRAGRGGNHSRAAAGWLITGHGGSGQRAVGRGAAAVAAELPASIHPDHTALAAQGGGTWWQPGAPHGGGPGVGWVGDGMCKEETSSVRVMLGMGPLPCAASSWLCLILLLSSICNFSNGLDGTNYSRKTVMQRRTRSNSAAGHSSGINHAAPMCHRWRRERAASAWCGAELLPSAPSAPHHEWGQPGVVGVSLRT